MKNYVTLMTLALLSTVSMANAMEEQGNSSSRPSIQRKFTQPLVSSTGEVIKPKPKAKTSHKNHQPKPRQENNLKLNDGISIAKPGLPTIDE